MRLREERSGGVLTLTMDHPARRNALASPLRAALLDALAAAQADRDVRCVVLTGAGGTFCSGGDVSGMAVASAAEGRERLREIHALIRLMVGGSVPVVAAVEGWCVGAGLSLACACDTVVAAADARLMAGFGRIGLMADLGLPHTLPARIGQGRARQMLLRGLQVDGAEAARIGLADEATPPGGALARAGAIAAEVALMAPQPIAQTKALLAAGLDAALERERHAQAALFLTADHAEGKAAFLAKRPPAFTGD